MKNNLKALTIKLFINLIALLLMHINCFGQHYKNIAVELFNKEETKISLDSICNPAWAYPYELKKNETDSISVHFDAVPCDNILYFTIRPKSSPIDSVASDEFIRSVQDDTVFYVYFSIPEYIDTGYADLFVVYFDGFDYYQKKVPTTLRIIYSYFYKSPKICMVTVNDQNKNQVIWKSSLDDDIDSIIVYREGTISGQFNKIGCVDVLSTNYFIDTLADPRQHANSYVISNKFKSGEESDKSRQHKTIHLTMNKGIDGSVNLAWDNYWGLMYQTYYIYRAGNSIEFEKIAELSASINSYTDINPPDGYLYYQIGFPAPESCDTFNLKSLSSYNFIVKSNYIEIAESVEPTSESCLSQNNNIEIYPNPLTNKTLYIKVNKDINAHNEIKIKLFGIDGKVYIHENINIVDSIYKVDLSLLNKGVYLLKVNFNNELLFKKIVIE